MALVQEDFRCNILWSAANCVGALCDHLGESVVNELKIAIVTNHDILWLEITIADVTRMEILEDACNLGAIQSGVLSVEVTHCAMVSKQITSSKQLRSEINVTIVLEKPIVAELKVR